MFRQDPNSRIGLEEIAKHPWVTKYDLPTNDEIMEEILRLDRARKGLIDQ